MHKIENIKLKCIIGGLRLTRSTMEETTIE